MSDDFDTPAPGDPPGGPVPIGRRSALLDEDLAAPPLEFGAPANGAAGRTARNARRARQAKVARARAREERPRSLIERLRARRERRAIRRAQKPRLRKLRLLAILFGLGILALISTVFGMMMAVASDLPLLENNLLYKHAANTFLYDYHWRPIGIFAPPDNAVIVSFDDISPWMRRAIVAVEDKRFWSEPGVDIRGIARAFIADVTGGARQGASTIAQQFVKNALQEQSNRTIFEKLREAALAYHLTREWKKKKILTEYLNSIYFGNGAYGIESAARVYFGKQLGYDQTAATGSTLSASTTGTTATGTTTTTGTTTATGTTTTSACGDSTPTLKLPACASKLQLAQAALLAGMVAAPSAFDPIANRQAAKARRDLVLQDMLQQGMINGQQYAQAKAQQLPASGQLGQPQEPTADPYFTSWLRPQILAALGHGVPQSVRDYRAYYGGLKIRTTLDLSMQTAAQQAISAELPSGYGLPTASLVTIDNKTGEVRAMVGGQDYASSAFNLATQARRQPGSAFKPFTLAMALWKGGYSPSSIIDSAPQRFADPVGKDIYVVHNFGNAYSGPISLAAATAVSDNSVFAQVGIHVGTARIAKLARAMGIRTPVSHNLGMILGGLRIGVDPLDMAHAYETFATGGLRVFNPVLGAPHEGPTGIAQINCPAKVCGGSAKTFVDKPRYKRIIPATIAATVHQLLEGVVTSGTGKFAAISGVVVAGKTGTTSNYGDAWFVGWTPQLTTAVWVGYPAKLQSMSTQYNGQPVEGGTYPAIIWHNFMIQALQILAAENATTSRTGTTTTTGTIAVPASSTPTAGTTTPSTQGIGTTGGAAAPNGTTGNGTAGNGTTGNGTTGGGTGTGTGTGTGAGSGGSGGAGLGGGSGTGTTPGTGTTQGTGTTPGTGAGTSNGAAQGTGTGAAPSG